MVEGREEGRRGGWMMAVRLDQDQPLDWHGVPPTGGKGPSRGKCRGRKIDKRICS
jgi:hypothetical protein